jgi:sarcosine oxidase subunit beta
MTPDGSPIIGRSRELEGYIHAVGMCGQGYMLGPGVGKLLTRMLTDAETAADGVTLNELTPYRAFGGTEMLK